MSKTVRLKFKNGEGKRFSISIAHALPALEENGGEAIAQAAVDTLMAKQPLNHAMAECSGVDVVDKHVTAVL